MIKQFRKKAMAGIIPAMLLLIGCQSDNFYDTIPPVLVNITLNLTNQEYLDLRFDGGYVEILGGYKGIIVYRENANSYKAFEKASPYRTDEACGEVFVHQSRLFMFEACANTNYDFNGIPIGGVGAQFALRQYVTQLDGIYLHITN